MIASLSGLVYPITFTLGLEFEPFLNLSGKKLPHLSPATTQIHSDETDWTSAFGWLSIQHWGIDKSLPVQNLGHSMENSHGDCGVRTEVQVAFVEFVIIC